MVGIDDIEFDPTSSSALEISKVGQ